MRRIVNCVFVAISLVVITASCAGDLSQPIVAVSGITLNKTNLSLIEGEEFTLVPTVTPDNATDKSVKWSSGNAAIVTVSAEGVVKALKAGKTIVTATTLDQGQAAYCSIDIFEDMSTVTGAATHISCRNAEVSGKAALTVKPSTDFSFGVLYSTSSEVIIGSATQIKVDAFDSDYNYTVSTGVLEPETTYYYRSYIIRDKEISYGELKSFTTLAVSSMIQTLDVTDIYRIDAVLNASLDLTDCRYDKLEYGFELTPVGGSPHDVKSSNHSENKFSAMDDSLSRDTEYSVVAYVTLDGRTYKGETKSFKTLMNKDPELVDLGLSVKWATWNLGASKPEEYGDYYQWAGLEDVTSTSIYLNFNYCPYHTGSSNRSGWTKYNTIRSYGIVDNKTVLDPDDDVAHVKLGGKWRMPTEEEWRELMNFHNCYWEWTSVNGIKGYMVWAIKTELAGNKIFLPAANYRLNDIVSGGDSFGSYWSSSLCSREPDRAYNVYFNSNKNQLGGLSGNARYLGLSVRPVSE